MSVTLPTVGAVIGSKNAFSQGHLPSPSAIKRFVRDTDDLELQASHSFGRDYAETLRRWARRFDEHASEIDALGFDERFRRMWSYYLSYCEAGFDSDMIDVRHVRLEKRH